MWKAWSIIAALGAGGVVGHGVGEGLTGSLSGEGNDAGGPAHGCGPGSGLEGYLAFHWPMPDICSMWAWTSTPPGMIGATRRLDHPARSRDRRADQSNAAAIDAQIALDNALWRDDLCLSDDDRFAGSPRVFPAVA